MPVGTPERLVNVGPREALDTLADEFKFNQKFVSRVQQLCRKGYVGWRRIRGDGNCFYRSVGFGLLEQIVAAPEEPDRLRWATSLRERLAALHFEEPGEEAAHAQLLQQIERLCRGEDWASDVAAEAHQDRVSSEAALLHSMRAPESIEDKALVRAFRRLTVDYLLKYADDEEANYGISFNLTCMAQDQGSALEFCDAIVRPMGIEAEGIVLNALPSAIGVGIRIAYLDRDGSSGKDLVFHDYCLEARGPGDTQAGAKGGKPLIHVQLRPGHYDLLYFHSLTPEQEPSGRVHEDPDTSAVSAVSTTTFMVPRQDHAPTVPPIPPTTVLASDIPPMPPTTMLASEQAAVSSLPPAAVSSLPPTELAFPEKATRQAAEPGPVQVPEASTAVHSGSNAVFSGRGLLEVEEVDSS